MYFRSTDFSSLWVAEQLLNVEIHPDNSDVECLKAGLNKLGESEDAVASNR